MNANYYHANWPAARAHLARLGRPVGRDEWGGGGTRGCCLGKLALREFSAPRSGGELCARVLARRARTFSIPIWPTHNSSHTKRVVPDLRELYICRRHTMARFQFSLIVSQCLGPAAQTQNGPEKRAYAPAAQWKSLERHFSRAAHQRNPPDGLALGSFASLRYRPLGRANATAAGPAHPAARELFFNS